MDNLKAEKAQKAALPKESALLKPAAKSPNTAITVPNIYGPEPAKLFDGSVYLPKEIGDIKLLRKECRDQIIYYDWDLSFKNRTFASRPDNFGKDEIQVIFNLNQNIEWQIDGDAGRELVSMKPGEVCVFRNNDYQTSMNYDCNVSFQFKSLQMSTAYFETLLSKYFPEDHILLFKEHFLSHVTKTKITSDMYHVISEIDDAEKYHEFKGVYVESKMIELIALVLHGITYNKSSFVERAKTASKGREEDFAQLESLRRRIQFYPAEDYSTPQLAKSLSMSESKLTRLFRLFYGTSIHRYVQDMRLERAASLIVENRMNVSEAAINSGYTNMSWFSKEFKEKFGITPKKYGLKNTENC